MLSAILLKLKPVAGVAAAKPQLVITHSCKSYNRNSRKADQKVAKHTPQDVESGIRVDENEKHAMAPAGIKMGEVH